ncbi:MAG: N-acetyl-gamma-glutamyl-phosphate reductase [Candidatus Omnitrophica bacterium]|nr:N-acetyl-gamma-glutamyl-phosphate reductase [Candidatus Omnitrophota bacterium]MBI2174463.1 N-acetyl-gamma-glutamyl-phosphate reductase [Candidatus Omnitrophota bacterium]MBI3009927.1 N-acetyl-gamma-glutamyl-phosphate reductase [Candidatus Omnitrophota bacterium]
MSRLRVAIAGATGYAGEELIRLLLHHPFVEITSLAASAKWEKPIALASFFPRFSATSNLLIEAFDPTRIARFCDVVFLALPHGLAMNAVPAFLSAGCRVIDLSGDFRLKDPTQYPQWYGLPHTHPELLQEAVYGIPELFSKEIAKARLVANPGCYATSVILACAPLLKTGWIETDCIIVDAKSGLTGAGRKSESHLMFSEINENLWPYKVNGHPHTPEIEQALRIFGGTNAPSISMVPQVVPVNRGILSSIYLRLQKQVTEESVGSIYHELYDQAPFVRLRTFGNWPKLSEISGTNFCDIAFAVDEKKRLLILFAAIDNLLKGAAGQAVQNLNLMCGFPETTALL